MQWLPQCWWGCWPSNTPPYFCYIFFFFYTQNHISLNSATIPKWFSIICNNLYNAAIFRSPILSRHDPSTSNLNLMMVRKFRHDFLECNWFTKNIDLQKSNHLIHNILLHKSIFLAYLFSSLYQDENKQITWMQTKHHDVLCLSNRYS